jgi:hypothetical protein
MQNKKSDLKGNEVKITTEDEIKNYKKEQKKMNYVIPKIHLKDSDSQSEQEEKEVKMKKKHNDENSELGTIIERINKLENINSSKDKKIQELQDQIRNYESNLNKIMSYPVYTPLAKKKKNKDEDSKVDSETIKEENNIDKDSEENTKTKLKSKKRGKKIRKNSSEDEKESNNDISMKPKKKKLGKNKKNKKEIDEEQISKLDKEENNEEEENGEDENELVKNNNSSKVGEENKNKNEMSGLPMVEREDLHNYINSRIIYTVNELKMLKKKILYQNRNCHAMFDILYRASLDGDYEQAIISNSEGEYPQIILFYTQEGARFGVYIYKEKTTSLFGESYKEVPGSSFLISLNSLKTYDIGNGGLATDNRTERLCFGRTSKYNKNGSNWLIFTPRNNFLGVGLTVGDQISPFGEIDMTEIVGFRKEYHIKDVEIFKVTKQSFEEDNISNENDNQDKSLQKKKKKSKKKKEQDENYDNENNQIEEE